MKPISRPEERLAPPARAGFSLVEIVIALGIVSVAVVAIFGLLPVAYRSALESRRETQAAFVAEQIIGDLRMSSFTNARIISLGGGEPEALPGFSLAVSGTRAVAGDEQNRVTREITAADYDAGLTDESLSFLARIRVEPAGLGNLSKVEVEVSAPAAAPLSARSRQGFFTLIGGHP